MKIILITISLLLLLQPVAARYLEDIAKKEDNLEEKRWAWVAPAAATLARYGARYGKPAAKHIGKWASAAAAAGLGSDAYKHAKAGVKKAYNWARNKWNKIKGRRDALDEYLHQKFQ